MLKLLVTSLSLAFVAMLFAAPSPAVAQESQAVAQIITLAVAPADAPAFMERIGRAQAINDRLETGARIEVWMSTIAGTESNQIAVVIHHDGIESWASSQAANAADEEWQVLLAEIQASDAVVISNSISTRLR